MAAKCDEDQAWHQPEKFGAISSKRLHRRLPSKDETRALLNQPFRSCELISSLYHEATFMALFESRFSQEYDEAHGPGWWASLNMLLAVAHRVRVMGDLTLQDDEDVSWLYFKNAMSVLSDLMLRTPHILSVQALLAMVSLRRYFPIVLLTYHARHYSPREHPAQSFPAFLGLPLFDSPRIWACTRSLPLAD